MDSEGAKSNADESTDGPMAKKEKLDVLIEKGNSFEKPTIVIKRLDKKSDKVKSLCFFNPLYFDYSERDD